VISKPIPHTGRVWFWLRRAGNLCFIILIWLGGLLCLAPLVTAVVYSLAPPPSSSPFHRPALLAYLFVLQSPQLWNAFKNTCIEEAVLLTTTLFFCPLAGYAFAKFEFHGKRVLFGLMILTLFFTPITLLIPLLLEMNELGWIDTYQGLIAPMSISGLGVFWMSMAIRDVPDDLLFAARLDGCGIFSVWWRIVLPVIRPSLLALAFVTFITAYNDYMWPLLILLSDGMQTVQLYLQTGSGYGGGASMPAVMITSLPTIVFFLIVQRYYWPELFKADSAAPPIADEQAFLPAVVADQPVPTLLPEARTWDTPDRWSVRTTLLALAGIRPWRTARTGRLIQAAAILGCTVLVYLNALPNSLRLDDFYRVIDNPGIEHFMPVWRHFTDPSTSAAIPPLAQFRPLLPLSLSINYLLSGNAALGYHLGNLVLDGATTLVIFLLVRELVGYWTAVRPAPYRADFLAMAVALLVALHPVSGMLVSAIAGRDLLLMQGFLAASLLWYARMQRRSLAPRPGARLPERLARRWFGGSPWGWLLVLALFELALLAKAQAIVAPALILAFELTLGGQRLNRMAPFVRTLPFALVAAAHLAYVALYLHFTLLPDAPNIGGDAVWTYPLTQVRLSVLHYLANFAWPFNLRQMAVEPTIYTLQDAGVIVGGVVIAASLIGARLLRRREPLLAFCLLGYWLMQAPESSIEPMLRNAVDYRPYPASVFLFLALALVLERRLKPATVSCLLLALLVFFGVATVHMNGVW
jgi:multiple sugar transport system permease protein